MSDHVEIETRKAVSQKEGAALKDAIRQLTLEALKNRQIDKKNVQEVVEQIFNTAAIAISNSQDRMEPVMQEVLHGIDEAISKAVEATEIATTEVMAIPEKLPTQQDIARLIKDFESLENVMFESLIHAMSSLGNVGSQTANRLVKHIKQTGPAVGESSLKALKTLNQALQVAGKNSLIEISHLSLEVPVNLARIGSGILSGMLDAMKGRNTK